MLLFILLNLFVIITHGKGILSQAVELYHGHDGILPREQALEQEKVNFQFYYETECPWSIKIYLLQLENTVKELAPYLDITTYPYGNAKMHLNGTELTIVCQHDEEECYGNMLHACAIDALKDATKYVPFNSCMMGQHFDATTNDEAADKCGKVLNIDSKPIKECAKGITGFQLLLHYGVESGKAKFKAVPWWYINGISKIRGEKRPLKELLCAAFKNPPEVCKQ